MWFSAAHHREKIHESTHLPNSSACVARVSRAVSRDHGLRRAIDRPVIEVPNPPNAAAQQSKPYIILVSLDGFRYDYAQSTARKSPGDGAPRASAPDE